MNMALDLMSSVRKINLVKDPRFPGKLKNNRSMVGRGQEGTHPNLLTNYGIKSY